jgi:hypothetical protein
MNHGYCGASSCPGCGRSGRPGRARNNEDRTGKMSESARPIGALRSSKEAANRSLRSVKRLVVATVPFSGGADKTVAPATGTIAHRWRKAVPRRGEIDNVGAFVTPRRRGSRVTCWSATFKCNGEGQPTHRLTKSPMQGVGRRRPGSVSGPQLALTISTEISTAGVVPLFSSQCVVSLSSGQPTPGPYSLAIPFRWSVIDPRSI